MEQHPDYHLPSARLRNTDLNRYATAIKEIASLKSVGLIDLYQPTLTMFGGADSPHTFNGVHLNDQGYAALAPILMSTLSDKATGADVNPLLTEAILDKSWFWKNDYRGRLWVSTVPSYPHYKPGGERPNDKLLIYEDTDGDGRADKETVFADGLHVPIGFELTPEGVYISEEPYLTIHKDTDGDARADTKEYILDGFDPNDTNHAISAFDFDNGGCIFMCEGRFLHSQVETPWESERMADGGAWRFDPKSWKVERVVQTDVHNPWGFTHDEFGQKLALRQVCWIESYRNLS